MVLIAMGVSFEVINNVYAYAFVNIHINIRINKCLQTRVFDNCIKSSLSIVSCSALCGDRVHSSLDD